MYLNHLFSRIVNGCTCLIHKEEFILISAQITICMWSPSRESKRHTGVIKNEK